MNQAYGLRRPDMPDVMKIIPWSWCVVRPFQTTIFDQILYSNVAWGFVYFCIWPIHKGSTLFWVESGGIWSDLTVNVRNFVHGCERRCVADACPLFLIPMQDSRGNIYRVFVGPRILFCPFVSLLVNGNSYTISPWSLCLHQNSNTTVVSCHYMFQSLVSTTNFRNSSHFCIWL